MRKCTFSRKAFLSLGLFALFFGGGLLAPAQADAVSEYQAKAAFIYNFTKFVQWPASSFSSPTSPLVIAVLGTDPFGSSLRDAVAGKSAEGHPLKVIRLEGTATADLTGCHLLFISSSEKERVGTILASLAGASVLTVADTERFAQKGGVIQFDQAGTKIQLVVNQTAAKKAKLTISSKLLQVAKILK
jgi:hypothetical protein